LCPPIKSEREQKQGSANFPLEVWADERKSVNLQAIMGRNKFSQKEIEKIGKLLRLKNSVNRGKQKLIRHELRVDYEFNISDFNEPGKAFGEEELQDAVKRGAIQILDDATIEAMKAKRARDKARDEAAREQAAVESGEQTDWKKAMEEWNEWENGKQQKD
jgi:hypothetical protein